MGSGLAGREPWDLGLKVLQGSALRGATTTHFGVMG